MLGMALNQFVMPGFALFRIGIRASGEDATLLAIEPDDEDSDEGPMDPPDAVDAIGEYDE